MGEQHWDTTLLGVAFNDQREIQWIIDVMVCYFYHVFSDVQSLPLESAFYTVFLAITVHKKCLGHCTFLKWYSKVGYICPQHIAIE